jgi:3-methyl-2-oxobutanoate hydroxymethyltransferase
MTRARPTVSDLRALKGQGQRTMLRIETLDEARAAEAAQIDIVSLPPDLIFHPEYRKVAPVFSA